MFRLFPGMMSMVSAPDSLNAVRVEQGPEIDGLPEDPVWECAGTVVTVFRQYGPDYGSDVTEPTETRVLCDSGRLHFGFSLHDPDQGRMQEALTPGDEYVTGEWIAVLHDTWGDGREACSISWRETCPQRTGTETWAHRTRACTRRSHGSCRYDMEGPAQVSP
ncbi:MAG: hypothetical protein AVO35_05555 [Candidatus Aegiribacteria sp. MLS_C]|nr:MAG: hypothetical protein AVO35_05555 [Candidatus Aegiribacteria sp. MLS_C]